MKNKIFLAMLFFCINLQAEVIRFNYAFSKPYVEKRTYDHISVQGLQEWSEPGKPVLPFKSVNILIPFGKKVIDVKFISQPAETLKGSYDIEPGVPIVPTSLNNTKISVTRDLKIYSQSFPYPDKISSLYTVQRLSGYDILICRLYPVQYVPAEMKLFYYKNVTVEITLSDNFMALEEQRKMILSDSRTLNRVTGLIDNKGDLTSYPVGPGSFNKSLLPPYDYIIITNTALRDSFQRLASWKISKGLEAHVFTTDSIYANCSGTDNQAKIRTFIKDCYTSWSGTAHPLKWVVLGGDDDVIPVRGCFAWATDGSIQPVDSLMPCDLYYSGLDGNWDADGDGIYGEGDMTGGGTGTSGEEADLLSEVAVGRVTVETPQEINHYLNKLIHSESSPDTSYLNRALFIGEQLDASTNGGDKKDAISYLLSECNIAKLYAPQMGANIVYDSAVSYLNTNPYIVNHVGHANWNIIFNGWGQNFADFLSNTEYFLMYSQGCYTNGFDNNLSGSTDAVSEHFIYAEHGAFAYIGNSRYGWYCMGSYEGPGEKFDREFFDALFTEKIINLGNAFQDAKEDLASSIQATGTMRWCYFTLNLLGDPETRITTEYNAPVARISSIPKNYGDAGVIGTAKAGSKPGATFLNYRVEYGLGGNPSVWFPMSDTFYTPVTNDTLCYVDTRLLTEDSISTLKLIVKDSTGRTTESKLLFTANNCDISVYSVPIYAAGDTVMVLGCAAAKNFTSYKLESKGTGQWDTTGIVLKNGGLNEVLWDTAGLWHLDKFNTGNYYVRLTVNGADTFYVQDSITIDNCFIMTPDDGDVLRMDKTIYIQGNASSPNFTYYNIKYALGSSPTSWDTTAITLQDSGRLPVRRGMLGYLNPSLMLPETTYTLRLYVSGEGADQIRVRFEQFYHTGWPKMPGGCNAPVAYDIDKLNPDIEVFVTPSGGYMVFNYDGSTEWSAPIDTNICTEPSIGNVAFYSEGRDEFVLASKDSLFAIHRVCLAGNWKPVAGFPLPIPGIKNCPPALAQLDTSELLEIVHCSSNDSIYAISGSAQVLPGWPKYAPGVFNAAVGNLDADSLDEVVFGDSAGHLWAVNGDGSVLPGWPVTLEGIVLTSSLGDIDKDGKTEIVVSTSEKLYIIKSNGLFFTGWTPKDIGICPPGVFQSPVIANMDSDSLLEIAISDFCTDGSIISVFNQDGSFVPGWPDTIYLDAATAPIVGNMDSDIEQEIMVGTASGVVYAYNNDGTFVPGYPRSILTQVWDGIESPSGTFVDLDNNGTMDVLWSSKYYTFAFNSRGGNPATSEWSTYRHDIRHTGCYDFSLPVGVEEQKPSLTFWVGKPLPNPFKKNTLLSFSVPRVTAVKISVFNLAGREVRILLDEQVTPGFHSVNWTGRDNSEKKIPAGIYFIRVKGIGDITTRKIILLK